VGAVDPVHVEARRLAVVGAGGWLRTPYGVVTALTTTHPCLPEPARVLALAATRIRARAAMAAYGWRTPPGLWRAFTDPPTDDEVDAVLRHPAGPLWRPVVDACGLWRPSRVLCPARAGPWEDALAHVVSPAAAWRYTQTPRTHAIHV
jgi:hypothetical protein